MSGSDPAHPSSAGDGAPSLHRSRSAARALHLLDTVITGGPMTLTDAAVAVGQPASTALRHLRVLTEHGYLQRDGSGRYSAGPTFIRIGLAAFRSGPYARLTAAAQPHLEHLAATTEESAYLAVRDGTEAVYIATVESPRAIRHVGWVGRSVPVDGTAVGAALLAAPIAPGDPPRVEHNTDGYEPDVTALSAPIHTRAGVLGALSLIGPAERLDGPRRDAAATELIAAAIATATALATPT